jgi:hypothetical protein
LVIDALSKVVSKYGPETILYPRKRRKKRRVWKENLRESLYVKCMKEEVLGMEFKRPREAMAI